MSFDSGIIRPSIGDLPVIDALEDRVQALEDDLPPVVAEALDLKPDSAEIDTITVLSQAAYNAILSPDARTLYIVTS